MKQGLLKKLVFPGAGKYILAVSGGVDSVCLLDILAKASRKYSYQLVVAHFDHGLRPDSAKDANFVKNLAQEYGLEFVAQQGQFPDGASEATAREARYKFLKSAKRQKQADNVITAHHFDDVLETAIFNAGRGSSEEGLTSMHLAQVPLRPFLQLRKVELLNYAKCHGLKWREDTTNHDLRFARNFIRHQVVPLLTEPEVAAVRDLAQTNQAHQAMGQNLIRGLAVKGGRAEFKREDFLTLSNDQSTLLIRALLRKLKLSLERAQLSALMNFMKTAANNRQFQGGGKLRAHIHNDMITLAKI